MWSLFEPLYYPANVPRLRSALALPTSSSLPSPEVARALCILKTWHRTVVCHWSTLPATHLSRSRGCRYYHLPFDVFVVFSSPPPPAMPAAAGGFDFLSLAIESMCFLQLQLFARFPRLQNISIQRCGSGC